MSESKIFNHLAVEYDQWFDSHKTEYSLELKAIKALLPKQGKGVEVGAGTGRFAQPLGISLGVEPSESMRKIARQREVNIIAGSAESLPIEDEVYDFALLVTVDCFLNKPEIAFKEVYRVIKEEGQIIVGLIDKNSVLGKKYQSRKNESKFYKDAKFHAVEEIVLALEHSGFKNFKYIQAILPGDSSKQVIKPGYGEGSFVVLQAQKSMG